jgi:hypothetical protein
MQGKAVEDGAVVVCGGGAAGMAAALAAARCGANVLLVESCGQLGGTVAQVLLHTLAGLYDSAGELLNDGLPRELVARLKAADPRTRKRKLGRTWVLQVCPHIYRQATTAWVREEQRIQVWCGSRVTRIARDGKQIRALEIAAGEERLPIIPAAVIDATGSAAVVRQLDASLVDRDGPRAAGGYVARLRGIAPGALEFPKGLAVVRALRDAAANRSLPWECNHAWIDSGIDADEAFLKLFVPLEDGWQEQRRTIAQTNHLSGAAIVCLLRTWPDFGQVQIAEWGALGVRDDGRIRGRYTLTADDVRQARKFADAACRCAWPIEYWDDERGVSLEYLPHGAHYDIPLRSLQLDGIDNLWAVGKCLSADRLAHASARVAGTCWAMGQAAGAAAASCTWNTESARESVPVLA